MGILNTIIISAYTTIYKNMFMVKTIAALLYGMSMAPFIFDSNMDQKKLDHFNHYVQTLSLASGAYPIIVAIDKEIIDHILNIYQENNTLPNPNIEENHHYNQIIKECGINKKVTFATSPDTPGKVCPSYNNSFKITLPSYDNPDLTSIIIKHEAGHIFYEDSKYRKYPYIITSAILWCLMTYFENKFFKDRDPQTSNLLPQQNTQQELSQKEKQEQEKKLQEKRQLKWEQLIKRLFFIQLKVFLTDIISTKVDNLFGEYKEHRADAFSYKHATQNELMTLRDFYYKQEQQDIIIISKWDFIDKIIYWLLVKTHPCFSERINHINQYIKN